MNIARDHLEDLRRSGLTDATIALCRFESVSPNDIPLVEVESAYKLPYFDLDGTLTGFSRMKLFPPVVREDGSIQKYHQPGETDSQVYLPPVLDWQSVADDPLWPVILTEGEKKATAACQCGFACIGVAGVWNWRQRLDNGERLIIPTLDLFRWEGRQVELVPDSDVWWPEKKQALQGFYALGRELNSRGARVTFIKLPEGP